MKKRTVIWIVLSSALYALLMTMARFVLLLILFRFLIASDSSPLGPTTRLKIQSKIETVFNSRVEKQFISSEEKEYDSRVTRQQSVPCTNYIPFAYLSLRKMTGTVCPVPNNSSLSSDILRKDSRGNKVAIVYISYSLGDFATCSDAVFVAVSRDQGKSFQHYFTGLEMDKPYRVINDPGIPLWKNDSVIQVRVKVMEQIAPAVLPGPGPEYGVLADSLVLEMNLNRLAADSDNDGLTDVLEAVWMTNPMDPDTDHDGIPDSVDMNPRFARVETDRTLLYEAAVCGYIQTGRDMGLTMTREGMERFLKAGGLIGDRKEVRFVVTDDPALKRISTGNKRIIFLSTKEYELYQSRFPGRISCSWNISPLFRYDNYPDRYKLTIGFGFGEDYYMVKKVKGGWIVWNMGGYII
jgi:hypothetical protein